MARTFSAESSATNLNSAFYLMNFYQANRGLSKAAERMNFHKTELSYEDSRALKKAAAKLSSFDYSEMEDTDSITSTIQAFAKTYNNTIESTDSKKYDTYRQNRQLKALTEKYADELKSIGITVESDGKLNINDNILKNAPSDKVKKIFSPESDYVKNVSRIARRIHTTSYNEIFTQMTGAGGKINIVL